MDKKRLIFLAVFVVMAIILGYALYRVFFAKKAAPPLLAPPITTKVPSRGDQFPEAPVGGRPTAGVTRPGLPQAAVAPGQASVTPPTGAPVRLIDNAVVGVAANRQGGVQFYNGQDGRFYRIGADGRAELMSDEVFYNVQKVNWSPTNKETILEYPDGSNIYYNFETKKQVTLPQHWQDFSFAPQGEQIEAKSIGFSPENRWLIAANPDGSEVKTIEPLGNNADRVIVDWSPNKQIIALSRTGDGISVDRQLVLPIGTNGENFRGITVEGRGLQTEWSPEGKKLLYSVYSGRNDFKPELWIDNAEPDTLGTGRKLLNVNTWADKCAFADERFVYCGVPEKLRTGAGFAPQTADQTPDRLYKIDIQTGAKTEISLPDSETHVINTITIAPDGKYLYFTDKTRQGVFRVPKP
ncbi:MAG: WD40 repeat domain-containing protein [Candidatus Magasanikbacteria bacterium]|nr:WD40 repeat domain-containing protein [Candidatus Magasanikbacteria bacterium]